MATIIYHLTTEVDYGAHTSKGLYSPPSLDHEGFVHGSGTPEVTLGVATSYFLGAKGDVWVLELDEGRLEAEVRWEAPAPPGGKAQPHHKDGLRFPHIYGAIPVAAIVGRGVLMRTEAGFAWPAEFEPLSG